MAPIYTITTVSSVSEAAKEAERIVETYRPGLEYYPQPIRQLLETISNYGIVLQDVSVVLDQYREALPQRNSFASKLDACKKLIEDFPSARKDSVGHESLSIATKTKGVVRKVLTRSRHSETNILVGPSHDGADKTKRCKALNHELELDINKLLSYIILKALRRSVIINDGSNGEALSADERAYIYVGLTQPSKFGPAAIGQDVTDFSVSPDEPFEVIYRRLLRLRSMYERARNRAIHIPGATENLEPLRKLVEAIWQAMNKRVGQVLPGGRAPELHIPTRSIFEGPSTSFMDIMLELTNESQHLTSNAMMFRTRRDSFLRPQALSPTISSHQDSQHGSPHAYRQGSVSSASIAAINPTPFTSPFSATSSQGKGPTFAPLPPSSLPSHTATLALNPDTGRKIDVYLQSWDIKPAVEHSQLVQWDSIYHSQRLEHYIPFGSFPRINHSSKSHMQYDVFFSGGSHHVVHYENDQPDFEEDFLPTYLFLNDAFRMDFLSDLRGKRLVLCFDTDVVWSDKHSKTEMGNLHGMARLEPVLFWQDRDWPYRHSFSFFANKLAVGQLEYPVLRFGEAKITSDGVRLDSTDRDFLPEVPTEDELEAAQMAPYVKVPKWLRIQFSGRNPKPSIERFLSIFNMAWKEDQKTRPKPLPPPPEILYSPSGTRLPPELPSTQLEPQEAQDSHIVPRNELGEGPDQLAQFEIPRRPLYYATPELEGSYPP